MNSMALLFLWSAVLILATPCSCASIDLRFLKAERFLGSRILVLDDVLDTLSSEAVLQMDASAFKQPISDVPRFRERSHPIYTRFSFYSKDKQDFFIELATPLIDEVRFDVFRKDGSMEHIEAGLRVPHMGRPFQHWNYVFPLSIQAGETITVVGRFKNEGTMELAIRAWNDADFYQYNHRSMVKVGFFYGLFIGVALLMILSFKTFQDRIYLYYFATMISLFLFLSCKNGIGLRFLLPEWMGVLIPFASVICIQLLLLSVLQFTRAFLNTRVELPRIDQLLRVASLSILGAFVLCLIIDPMQISVVLPYLALVCHGIVAVAMLRKKNFGIQNAFFVLGMIVPMGIGFIYAFQYLLNLSNRFVSLDDFYWGFLFTVVFIGLGLGKRLQLLQQEKMLLQRQSVENLQKADQMKDEFLASTSHELRTPLNGIIGITEGLIGDIQHNIPVKAQRSLKLIVTCGHRLLNLINDILDYSLLRNGEIKMNLKTVQVRQVASIAMSILTPLAKKKSIEMANGVPLDCPGVVADEDRLQQILLNLLGNAVKFTNSGSVKVTSQVIDDRELVVCVEDSGIGIAKESHERIFEMFHQVDAAETRAQGGTGIGLSLTRKLVTLMGGEIWVESTLGHGSKFFFTLPISVNTSFDEMQQSSRQSSFEADVSMEADPIVVGSSSDGDAPVILIVDDEPINLQVLVNQLSIEGYDLKVASRGEEALHIIQVEGPPSMVLLDLMMPGMSGFDVCAQLRRDYDASTLPIIFLTAKNQMQDLVKGLEIGANDFLAKPFTRPELLARVRSHLGLAKFHKAYSRFVPQEFLKQIHRENLLDVQLGEQSEQYLGVLVADIRAFTSLVEGLSSSEAFAELNHYLSYVAPVIRENGGFVSKYIGDGMIALFPDGAEQAYKASQEILKALAVYNQSRIGSEIQIGIGVQIGKAILGTVGYQSRMDVTVVSSKLVQAVQLERLTKVFGCVTLVSSEVVRQMAGNRASSRLMGRIKAQSSDQWMEFYELPLTLRKSESKARFEAAVRAFWEEDYGAAKDGFEQVLEMNPDDQSASVYLDRILSNDVSGFPSSDIG